MKMSLIVTRHKVERIKTHSVASAHLTANSHKLRTCCPSWVPILCINNIYVVIFDRVDELPGSQVGGI